LFFEMKVRCKPSTTSYVLEKI